MRARLAAATVVAERSAEATPVPSNAVELMASRLGGKEAEARALHPKNANLPMLVTLVAERSTELRLVPVNAPR